MALDRELFEKVKLFARYHMTREDFMGYEEFCIHFKENIEAEGCQVAIDQEIFHNIDNFSLFYYMNYLIFSKIERAIKEMDYLKPSLEGEADHHKGMILQ